MKSKDVFYKKKKLKKWSPDSE